MEIADDPHTDRLTLVNFMQVKFIQITILDKTFVDFFTCQHNFSSFDQNQTDFPLHWYQNFSVWKKRNFYYHFMIKRSPGNQKKSFRSCHLRYSRPCRITILSKNRHQAKCYIIRPYALPISLKRVTHFFNRITDLIDF